MARTALLATLLVLGVGLAGCARNQRTDAVITTDVKQNLAKALLPETIGVATNDGVVTLAGVVPDAGSKQRAGIVAGDVKGVHQVVNNLHATMAGDAPTRPNEPPNPPAGGREGMPNPPQSQMPANPSSPEAPPNIPAP